LVGRSSGIGIGTGTGRQSENEYGSESRSGKVSERAIVATWIGIESGISTANRI
jgi:hypothetical protein